MSPPPRGSPWSQRWDSGARGGGKRAERGRRVQGDSNAGTERPRAAELGERQSPRPVPVRGTECIAASAGGGVGTECPLSRSLPGSPRQPQRAIPGASPGPGAAAHPGSGPTCPGTRRAPPPPWRAAASARSRPRLHVTSPRHAPPTCPAPRWRRGRQGRAPRDPTAAATWVGRAAGTGGRDESGAGCGALPGSARGPGRGAETGS